MFMNVFNSLRNYLLPVEERGGIRGKEVEIEGERFKSNEKNVNYQHHNRAFSMYSNITP